MKKEVETFYPTSEAAWRKWLEKNHRSSQAVWLVFHTKDSGRKSLSWNEAVDTALCFGWIDSKKIKIDKETFHQFFSKRKPKSTWSKINKQKIEHLTAAGLMTKAGLEAVEIARENGSWTILDEVEELVIPKDLQQALLNAFGSEKPFLELSKTARKILLAHLVLARRQETRIKRIQQIIEAIVKGG